MFTIMLTPRTPCRRALRGASARRRLPPSLCRRGCREIVRPRGRRADGSDGAHRAGRPRGGGGQLLRARA
eukprot:928824-Prorocentrum_minimum.AAC.1